MSNELNLKLVGKVREAHGLKGDLYVLIFSGDVSWAPSLKEFALKSKATGELIKMSAQRLKPFKRGIILKASEISDRNQSEAVEGCEFYVPENLLVAPAGETIFLSEIEGFMVKAPDHTDLGPIIGFGTNSVQDLLVIEHRGKKSEIPFVDAFIKKIDFKKRYIVMDLPEGLLQLEESSEASPSASKSAGKAAKKSLKGAP